MYGKLALFIFAAWAGQAVSLEAAVMWDPAQRAVLKTALDCQKLPAAVRLCTCLGGFESCIAVHTPSPTCVYLLPAQGNGIIVGLGICGVVFAATSSAATLMGDFRTGYMCLTAPRAMFVAQLIGQLIGALLAPVAFLLFWGTGQVNVPNGPYPGE